MGTDHALGASWQPKVGRRRVETAPSDTALAHSRAHNYRGRPGVEEGDVGIDAESQDISERVRARGAEFEAARRRIEDAVRPTSTSREDMRRDTQQPSEPEWKRRLSEFETAPDAEKDISTHQDEQRREDLKTVRSETAPDPELLHVSVPLPSETDIGRISFGPLPPRPSPFTEPSLQEVDTPLKPRRKRQPVVHKDDLLPLETRVGELEDAFLVLAETVGKHVRALRKIDQGVRRGRRLRRFYTSLVRLGRSV